MPNPWHPTGSQLALGFGRVRLGWHAPLTAGYRPTFFGSSVDLDELRAILAVAETGSVLAASDRLRLTRTTLRRRLESLEARVGAPLIFRGPGGATLTDAGDVVVRHARTILSESAALLAAAREAGESGGGTLRVVMPVGMPPVALTALYGAIHAMVPGMAFEARMAEDPLHALVDDVDLAFHFGDPPETGAWITRVMRPAREVLVASASCFERLGRPDTVEDLERCELLIWRRPGHDPHALPLADGRTVPIRPMLVTSDVHILHTLAADGAGIALVPDGQVPGTPDVVHVMPELVGRDCPLRMLVPEAMAQSPKVKRLLDAVSVFLG